MIIFSAFVLNQIVPAIKYQTMSWSFCRNDKYFLERYHPVLKYLAGSPAKHNITFWWRNISEACRSVCWNFRWFRDKLSEGNQSAKLITIFCVKKWLAIGGLTKNFIYSKTDYSIMLRLWNTMVVYSAETKVFFKQSSE